MFIRETTMERMIDIMKPEDRKMLMEKLLERFSSTTDEEEKVRITERIIRKMGKASDVHTSPGREDLITLEILERMEKRIRELNETNRHLLEELRRRRPGSS